VVTALVVLPLFYNPDELGQRRPVEREKFNKTLREVGRKFGGGAFHGYPQIGIWASHGIIYEEEVGVLEVDIPDTEQDRTRLVEYAKRVLLQRFDQEAIYIKFVPFVEVRVVQARR